jgi:hypothetical protein
MMAGQNQPVPHTVPIWTQDQSWTADGNMFMGILDKIPQQVRLEFLKGPTHALKRSF